jgi:hypothetical protein
MTNIPKIWYEFCAVGGGGHPNSIILFSTTYNNITSDKARRELTRNPLQSNKIQKYTIHNSSFVKVTSEGRKEQDCS